MAPKLSIIFVVGAYHTEFHAQPLTPLLEKYNYRVVPVKLWTSSRHEVEPTLQDNIDIIRKTIQSEAEAGHDICLIAHSVAGQSSAVAASDFLSDASRSATQKAQLKQIIFVACFFNAMRLDAAVDWWDLDVETLWAKLVKDPADIFYNDMPREDAQPFVDALDDNRGQWPPTDFSDLWRTQVKTAYFLCLKDNAVPPRLQRLEAEENGMPIIELDVDHCPLVSKPKVLAEAIHKVLCAS